MKKIFFIICITIISQSLSFVSKAQDNIVDEIIWVVGDEAILKSDVEKFRIELERSRETVDGDPYCRIPEELAVQKLFLNQAKLDSIEVSDSQINQYVDRMINARIGQFGSRERMEQIYEKPLEEIRDEWRESTRQGQIVNEMQKKIVGNIKLTPGDVRKFYSKLPQDSLPFIPTTVEVQIITIEPKISVAETERIKGRLREFTDQVNKGEREFSTLARLWSEDESSKVGGELGFKGKGEFVPEFSAVAFALNEPKKVSKIVETEYGYHIIQLIEKRGDRANFRHILLKPKVSESELKEASLRLDSIATEIRAGKFSFEEAATYISYDKDTRNNKGLMVNTEERSNNYGTSRFEMQELPSDIAKVVYNMKPGEISAPFTYMTLKQKQVVAVVKLTSRIEGHKANVADDYQILKVLLEEKKREEILNKWIAQKQKEVYIRINENWKNCDFKRDGWVK